MMGNERKFLTAQDVEDIYNIKKGTLAQWRSHKIGPPYYKIMSQVRYDQADVEEYLSQYKVRTVGRS